MASTSGYSAKRADSNGRIEYSDEEHALWAELYAKQRPLVAVHSAAEFQQGLQRIELPHDRVPQCVEVSERLQSLTGWRVAPVPALIGFERFFAMLAERVFPAASFIRLRKHLDYIEEPDIFHELFGHTPLLSDQRFADFSQAVGEAGLRAEKNQYAWLIRLYWFTIEFGLVQHQTGIKALGSGLASSPTELPYSLCSPEPLRRPFDVLDILRTPYRIDIHQSVYFVLESVDELFEATNRDLLADVKAAQQLGLFPARYAPINSSTRKAS